MIREIMTTDSIDDTKIVLVFEDGSVVVLDENDHPCFDDAKETF